MALLIQRRARAKGVELAADAVDLLVGVLGADTIPLDGELEKLCCYAGGPGAVVTAAMVEEMCQGDGEATAWSFLDAVGERKLEKALDLARTVLVREKETDSAVLRLVQMLAGQFRTLLQVRVFMQEHGGLRGGEQVKAAVQRMSGEERAAAMRRGYEFVEMHAFRLSKLAGQAVNFRGNELVGSLPRIRDAYWKCVTGGSTARRAVLDDLVVQLVRG
jgi:DNA polymerase III delta subunit